jgi:FkbM family methyltransferase
MTVPEFIYTVILRPPPLRRLANRTLQAITLTMLRRHGAKIMLNPRDPVISGALTLGVYERAETDFFLHTCRPGMTFLDIGANIGYYTALAQTLMKQSGRIISLEPDPENFSFLQKTVSANGGTGVECVRKAASDHAGSMTLFTNSENRGDNRLYANQLANSTCEVEVVTVDALLEGLGVPAVDFIKMDVQGYESHVLGGMIETLRRSPRLTLLSEFWPEGLRSAGGSPEAYLSRLADLGFKLYELREKCVLEPITDPAALIAQYTGRQYTNIVAVKPSPVSAG